MAPTLSPPHFPLTAVPLSLVKVMDGTHDLKIKSWTCYQSEIWEAKGAFAQVNTFSPVCPPLLPANVLIYEKILISDLALQHRAGSLP